MAAINYAYIHKFWIQAELTQPMHVGSGAGSSEEVLIHPVTRIPFVQASGIAGPFRAYYAAGKDAAELGDVFGISGEELPKVPDKKKGNNKVDVDAQIDGTFGDSQKEDVKLVRADDVESRICFTDGIFVTEPKMELRPHVKIDPVSGTVAAEGSGGQKFNTEYIGAGAVIKFFIYLYGMESEAKADETMIVEMLTAINTKDIQFGGMKSTGCGFMKIANAAVCRFDMQKSDDIKKWQREDGLDISEYDPLTIGGSEENASAAYSITVSGKTEGAMLIRSIAVPEVGEDAPDSMNIQNAAKEYIVPGSSLKGAIKNRIEIILAYLEQKAVVSNTEKLVIDAFGGKEASRLKEERYTGRSGNLRFSDTKVGEKEDNDKAPLQHRIHIDKFTGGVMHGGKFSEKNIAGDFTMTIRILDKNEPKKTCALLTMALRDLMIGAFNLGSGYNVGKGFVDIDKVKIVDKDKKSATLTKSGVTDADNIISECLKDLSSGKEAK